MFKIGDKAHLNGRPETRGTITQVRTNGLWGVNVEEYLLEHDNPDLIPPKDWYLDVDLIFIPTLTEGIKIKCECGVHAVMPNGRHSTYCPMYREEA